MKMDGGDRRAEFLISPSLEHTFPLGGGERDINSKQDIVLLGKYRLSRRAALQAMSAPRPIGKSTSDTSLWF